MNSEKILSILASLVIVSCAMLFSTVAVSAVHTTTVIKTISAGNNTTFQNSVHCGSGLCYSKFSALTVNSSVTSYFGTSGNTCEKVISTITGPNNSDLALLYDISGNNYNWTTFDLDVDPGDTITLTNKYYNCD